MSVMADMLSANNEKSRNLMYNVNNGNKHGAADGYYKELFADYKNSASECNESSLSNCRTQPILSKSLYSLPADDISARTGVIYYNFNCLI